MSRKSKIEQNGNDIKSNPINEEYKKGKDIILKSRGANFFGQESSGIFQMRGNGNLILYESFLFFKQWITKKNISISIENIKAIETPRSHLGKAISRPLLKVIYVNESGQLDSIAWYVNKLDSWVSTLNQMIS